VLKVETVNPVRSFKGRGADLLLASWQRSGDGLVCASAGNFGMAMAYVARRRRIGLHVVVPASANPVKVRAIQQMGAGVTLHGADYDQARDQAKSLAASVGGVFVEDGVEPAISEGAGTIGVELASSLDELDDVVLPVGGGALASGVGAYLKSARPRVRVVGVCATGAPSMTLAWRGEAVHAGEVDTIADGIAIRAPVPVAVARLRAWVDEMLLVDDDAILRAMELVLREHGLVVEPAGAAGLAAVLAHRERFRNRTVAVPICGGNIDAALARAVLPGRSDSEAASERVEVR
jgi:threonine dehydratase